MQSLVYLSGDSNMKKKLRKSEAAACPCGSGLPLSECCWRYHNGAAAPDAVSLMRSRYSAFVFGLELAAELAWVLVFKVCVSAARDVDFACLAVLLHACCGVYGVAPNVVHKLFYTRNACYHRTTMHPNSDLKFFASGMLFVYKINNGEGRCNYLLRMLRMWLRKSTYSHVGIANSFDFF